MCADRMRSSRFTKKIHDDLSFLLDISPNLTWFVLERRDDYSYQQAEDNVWYAAIDILIWSRTRSNKRPRSGQLIVTSAKKYPNMGR